MSHDMSYHYWDFSFKKKSGQRNINDVRGKPKNRLINSTKLKKNLYYNINHIFFGTIWGNIPQSIIYTTQRKSYI